MDGTQTDASPPPQEPYRVRWTAPDRGRGHPPPLNTPSVFKAKGPSFF